MNMLTFNFNMIKFRHSRTIREQLSASTVIDVTGNHAAVGCVCQARM